MKFLPLFCTCSALLIGSPLDSRAIDRDARLIDMLAADVHVYEDADYAGLSLSGEIAVSQARDTWSILAGVHGGEISTDALRTIRAWGAELGLRRYITPSLSVSLLGGYTLLHDVEDTDLITGTVAGRFRFVEATDPLCPYAFASASLLLGDATGRADKDKESFVDMLLLAGLGCDINLTEEAVLVFEGAYAQSEDLDDPHGLDFGPGLALRVAMKYYWP